MRIFRIWLLLRKLRDRCYEAEAEHPDHFESSGHIFRLAVPEQEFLDDIAGNNKRKRAKLADLLRIADEKMGLLDSRLEKHKCSEADCTNSMNIKLIHLNDDGLEFVEFLDFMEYLGKNYPIGWGVVGKTTTLLIVSSGALVGIIYALSRAIVHVLANWPL